MERKHFLADLGITLALIAGNLVILAPYAFTDFSSQPWSNEYVQLAVARMFRDQPWTWNPLQYGGAPLSYAYPPLFNILLLMMPFHSLGRAYHVVSALGYALGPVSVYIASMQLFRSRLAAAFAAVAYSVFPSPVYYLLPQWGGLASRFHRAPWPFVALIGYNEAAHTIAIAGTLLVVALAWRDRWGAASFCGAALFLLHWSGTVSWLAALTLVAAARAREIGYGQACARVVATAGVAYGITAFWMTPGFFQSMMLLNRVVLRHVPPAAPWNGTTWLILFSAAVLAGLAFGRRVPRAAALILLWLALFGSVVASFSLVGNQLLPLPNRYVMELNAGLFLALAWLIFAARKWRVALAAAVLAWGGAAAAGFLRHAWAAQPRPATGQETPAFQISDWLRRNAASSRVFASGEVEGSLNVWADVAQVGGNGQGVSNLLVMAAQREIAFGCADSVRAARIAELWLRALDVRYVVVHDASSKEHFHWFVQPERFAAFPVAWENHAGDRIYRLPIPEAQEAVVVDLSALERLPPLRSTDDLKFLEDYVGWARGTRPASSHWNRVDEALVEADLGPNEGVLVKVNHHRGWQISRGELSPDPIGFLLIRAPAGHQRLKLRFGASWEAWLGRAITILTVLLLLARVPAHVVGLFAILAGVLAYGALALRVPDRVAVAEDSFRRIHPPLINPEGIVDGISNTQPPLTRGGVVTIYGVDFGSEADSVRVWLGDREAQILYRAPHHLNVQLPKDAPPIISVSVEVDGCRGNSFAVPTRD